MEEPLVMYYTIEMLGILDHLHKMKIIHGDVKPDNFLIQNDGY
jgi:checkpoint serine/threonine-protein kinase